MIHEATQMLDVAVSNQTLSGIKAKAGLAMVVAGEDQTIMGWLQYGEALNEIRGVFPSNEEFGQYLVAEGLDVYPNVVCGKLPQRVERHDRLAAMWAAANHDEFDKTREEYPNVRTVRGLHAKFKNPKPEPKREMPNFAEADIIRKLKVLAERGATDGERQAAQRKLDGYSKHLNTDAVRVSEPEEERTLPVSRDEMVKKMATMVADNITKKQVFHYVEFLIEVAFKSNQELADEFEDLMEIVE